MLWSGDEDTISINLGCLEATGDLKLTAHIFVADKGDYYDIADSLPQSAGYAPPD